MNKKMVIAIIMCFTVLTMSVPFEAIASTQEESTFTVLTYNIAGLPKALAGNNLGYHNTPEMGQLMSDYNIVAVQEDFSYHDVLLENAKFPYYSNWSGDVPLGSILDIDLKSLFDGNVDIGEGLNLFSTMPMSQSTRIAWDETYGWAPDDGADKFIPKGFTMNTVEISPDVFIDVYNLHGDAGFDDGSCEARGDNMRQIGEYIKAHSGNRAVIVMGDTNAYHHRKSDGIKENLMDPNGLKDPWIELIRDGEFPEATDQWKDLKMWEKDTDPNVNRVSPDYEPVDKVFYRSGEGVNLQAIAYTSEEDKFQDASGNRLSDHYAWTVKFSYTLEEPQPQQLYLSHLKAEKGFNGYGPVETDRTNGDKKLGDGGVMKMDGMTYSKGMGTHANSELTYKVPANYTQFKADVRIQDGLNGGSIKFEVWGDNTKLYDSGPMVKYTPKQHIDVNIEGFDQVTLKVIDYNGNNRVDHGNWGNARYE